MKNGLISNNTATNMGGGVALALSYGELRSSNFGYIKSKVRLRKATSGRIFVIKTTKMISEGDAEKIRNKQDMIRERRHKKNK